MRHHDFPDNIDDWDGDDWESGSYHVDDDRWVDEQRTSFWPDDEVAAVAEDPDWDDDLGSYDKTVSKLDQYVGRVRVESVAGGDQHVLKIELTSAQLDELSRPDTSFSSIASSRPAETLRPEEYLLLWVVEHVLEWADDSIRERQDERHLQTNVTGDVEDVLF